MSFRLVPKLVTLNDLERRNGPYFALFYRIFVYDVATPKRHILAQNRIFGRMLRRRP